MWEGLRFSPRVVEAFDEVALPPADEVEEVAEEGPVSLYLLMTIVTIARIIRIISGIAFLIPE